MLSSFFIFQDILQNNVEHKIMLNIILSIKLQAMELILTYFIRFIVTWDSLRFSIIRFADYKSKLSQVTINRIQCVKISFIS
jgi:hypothetical protein